MDIVTYALVKNMIKESNDITVPTKISQLENDSGFITADDILENGGVTDEQIVDAVENYLAENPIEGGFVEIDTTLTKSDQAADAKTTGDRLTDIEYQTVTTDLAFEHKDLPEGEKTVTVQSGDTWGDTVYVSSGEDLVPRTTFNRKFPYNGITVEKNGYTYHLSGTATANSGIYFTHVNNDTMSENIRGLGGKTLKLVAFSDTIFGNNVRIFIQFYDENKVDVLGQIKHAVFKTSTTGFADIVVPENAFYINIWLQIAAGTILDNDVQVYLNLAEKTQASTEFENIAVNDDESTYVMSFPYESVVSIKAPIAKYIDYMTANAKGDTATYLTPEAFGAVGDGYADDIEAIRACLDKANTTGQTVLMAQKYLISAPIDINGNDFNININDIIYNGTDTAVKIHGQRNTVKIHSITSSGVGVKFLGDGTKQTLCNDLEINTINSQSHGITFTTETVGSTQNTVHFKYIKAGGVGCYGVAYFDLANNGTLGEDSFYGGHISNCEWACYGVRGNSKFYGIQIESNVQGGFYIDGHVRIIQPRYAESSRDGSHPFFKFMNAKYTKIDSSVPLSINEIDISENVDYYETADGTQGVAHESIIGTIDIPLISPRTEVGEDIQRNVPLTNKAYIWGKYIIMTPHMAYRKVVTTEALDTRLIDKPKGSKEETYASVLELSQLPTKFVVDTVNTEIYLHASYCAFGFNEFEVEQANGFTCKIYDVYENLIFDGTDKGNGIYKLNVYKDADICANKERGKASLSVDFLGHYWSVTKQADSAEIWVAIDEIGGGVNEIEAMIDESGVLDE